MQQRYVYLRLIVVIAVFLLSACSVLHPTEISNKAKDLTSNHVSWQETQQPNAEVVTSLMDLMAVPGLQSLVQQGVDANPGLQQTEIALEISRAAIRSSQAERIPNADLSLQKSKKEEGDASYTSYLTVSWVPDIWNQLGDSISASKADAEASASAYRYARDLLAADIMGIWLQLIQQKRLLDIESARLAVLENNEAIIVDRYRKGLDQLTGLDTARSKTESSKATLIAAEESYRVLIRSLTLLLGADVSSLPDIESFPTVAIPLSQFPSQDLARRPDLQQAYNNIVVAEYKTAVAYKALLPSLSLQGALIDSGTSFRKSFFNSATWELLGQLTAPLFQGGQLRAQADIAKLTTEKAYWAYQESLLLAINEIESTLSLEESLEQQQIHIQEALANAERSSSLYSKKYRQGLVSLLDLLDVQSQTFDLKSQLTTIIYQRLSNRIALGLALGLGIST